MKSSLLISAAIVGLVAGVQATSAQSPSGQAPGQKMEQPGAPGASSMTQSSPGTKENRSPPQGKAAGQGSQTGAPSTAQREDVKPSGTIGQHEDRKPSAATDRREDRNPSNAMGQGQLGQGKEHDQSDAGRPSTAQPPPENRMGQQPSDSKMGQSSASTTNVNVNLSPEQRTKIRETVIGRSTAPRLSRSNINFDINVGVAVPHSVHVVALPDEVIEIHPAWRGFMYFLVGDEIVVVEPGSLRIVAVLPA